MNHIIIPAISSLLLVLSTFNLQGQFLQEELFGNNIANATIDAVDLDGDGYVDLISRETNAISWYRNIENKGFAYNEVITPYLSFDLKVDFYDYDVDGDLDLLLTDFFNSSLRQCNFYWIENLNRGKFGPLKLIADSLSQQPIIRDLDLDGDVDLILPTTKDTLLYLKNDMGLYQPQKVMNKMPFTDIFDFNQDGYLDYLYNDLVYFSIDSIIHQKFSTVRYNLNRPYQIVDIDRDGNLDIYNRYHNGWSRNLGNSLEPFKTFNGTSMSNNPNWYDSFHDVDNDGIGDIIRIVSSSSGSQVNWFKGNSQGVFNDQGIVTTIAHNTIGNGSYKNIAIGDYDGNGFVDILIKGESNSSNDSFNHIHIFYNQNGTFLKGATIKQWKRTNDIRDLMKDVNGDGKEDVIMIGGIFTIGIEGQKDSVGLWNRYETTDQTVAYRDLDGDSLIDVVFSRDYIQAAYGTGLFWRKNLGNFEFSEARLIADSLYNDINQHINITHINGDSLLDISIRNNGVLNLFIQQPNKRFKRIVAHRCSNFNKWFDLDGDGDNDIVYPTGWHENQGNLSFQYRSLNGGSDQEFHVFDCDNDGDLDIVSAENTGYFGLVLFENLGNKTFATKRQIANGFGRIEYITSSDMDHDGDQDILICRRGPVRWINWLENLGNLTFTVRGVGAGSALNAGVVDVNCDGLPDVVSSEGKWYKNNGNKTFATAQRFSPSTFTEIHVGDLNLDGNAEVYSSYHYWQIQPCANHILTGRVFHDENANKVLDPSEKILKPIFTLNPYHNYLPTYDSLGKYHLRLQKGNYELKPNVDSAWQLTTDSLSYGLNLDNSNLHIDSLDFGYRIGKKASKVRTTVSPSFIDCDSVNFLEFSIVNIGTTRPKNYISLKLDNNLNYLSAVPVPDSIQGQNLIWIIDTLDYFQSKKYVVKCNAKKTNHLISYLQVSTTDSTSSGIILDSIASINICNTGGNFKYSISSGKGRANYINVSEEIIYIIGFQKNKADSSRSIKIEDRLDKNLDSKTLRVISQSHNLIWKLTPSGTVIWTGQNLNIPDTSKNLFESRGWIMFGIKPKPGVKNLTQISNLASIAFSQNQFYETNTVTHRILNCKNPTITIGQNKSCVGERAKLEIVHSPGFSYKWFKNNTLISSSKNAIINLSSYPLDSIKLEIASNHCPTMDTIVYLATYPNPVTYDSLEICDDTTAVIGGLPRLISGVYQENLVSINSCDTTLFTYLKINKTYNLNLPSQETCEGDSVQIFGSYRKISGTYSKVYLSTVGCDSVVNQQLIVRKKYLNDLGKVPFCYNKGLAHINTRIWKSGLYVDTLQSIYGCDSIVKLNALSKSVDTSVVTGINYLLTTTLGSVQWYNCSTKLLENDTSHQFFSEKGGHYSAIIMEGNCTDTTQCYSLIPSSSNDFESRNERIKVYPIPASERLNVILLEADPGQQTKLKLSNTLGKMMLQQTFKGTETSINISGLPQGVYLLEVSSDSGSFYKSLIIDR